MLQPLNAMMSPVILWMVRIVLDTSVLVSALRSERGAAAEVIRRVMLGELTVLMDHNVAYEYRDVAFRARHLHAAGKSREQIVDILNLLEAQAEAVRVYFRPRPLSTDPNDDMVLDVAINGNADAVVTFNTRHFQSAAEQYNVDVVNPAELLARIRTWR
jgi:putative PIN family toxin of toxin-antitoxin system